MTVPGGSGKPAGNPDGRWTLFAAASFAQTAEVTSAPRLLSGSALPPDELHAARESASTAAAANGRITQRSFPDQEKCTVAARLLSASLDSGTLFSGSATAVTVCAPLRPL